MRRTLGVTRRDPQKAIKDSTIPTAASLPGSAITQQPPVSPEYLGTGTPEAGNVLRGDGTWGPATLGARSAVQIVTAALEQGEFEEGTVSLGKAFIPLRIVADGDCRVQLYQTAARRTADEEREPGTDPLDQHGVLLDVRLVDAEVGLEWDVQNPPNAQNCDSPVTATIYYRITNEDSEERAVTVDITRLVLEA